MCLRTSHSLDFFLTSTCVYLSVGSLYILQRYTIKWLAHIYFLPKYIFCFQCFCSLWLRFNGICSENTFDSYNFVVDQLCHGWKLLRKKSRQFSRWLEKGTQIHSSIHFVHVCCYMHTFHKFLTYWEIVTGERQRSTHTSM